MQDSLGSVQSVLVLGGGSDIAHATLRALVAAASPHDRARGTRHRVARAAGRPSCATRARERVETIAFDAFDTEQSSALVDDVFDRVGDIDLALLAFGVLGDQDEAERDSDAAVDIAQRRTTSARYRSACPSRSASAPRATARSWRCRRWRASGHDGRTSCTGRRRRAWMRSSRAWATAWSAAA